ncbi:hypothetical protein [Uliginosibacterium gangwonense]|uniref:hypothetical protein n=1 Tax=Uliginosibacterium gangwonense TaxID=392736 RepID=UPI00038036BF|nr:hypothetical protein [Uliginosibacterium gangwonense]
MNPFAHTLKNDLTDVQLDAYIRRSPPALQGLGRLTPESAEFRLGVALEKTVEPTDQMRRLLRHFLTIAAEHCIAHYPDEETFRRRCYQSNLTEEQPKFLICLTGLSGVGKSGILGALERILNDRHDIIALDNLPSYPVQPLWPMTVKTGVTLPSLLRPFLSEVLKAQKQVLGEDLLQVASKAAHARGVSLVFADEFQFISTSQEAHANAAKILLQLSRLGPPLVYCVNYDMVGRLEKRPQQERSRLFKKTLVLYPDSADSADWHATLAAQLGVADELCGTDKSISIARYGEMIHHFTFGIKGFSAKLLLKAYSSARRCGREYISPQDIEMAYKSGGYYAERQDVELLKLQVITGKSQRHDLWCNFAAPAFISDNVQEINSSIKKDSVVVQADRAIAEHKRRVLESYAKSSLDPEAREALAYLEKPPATQSAKVVKLNKPRATKDELLKGFSEFMEKP